MKPLNINKEACTPTSSNCIIWQGPELECIGLCKGDTITEAVYELATRLCKILETLDVSKYDLTCLDLASCPPETFEELLQILIEKICEIQANPCPPCEDGVNGDYVVTEYEPAGENCEFGGVVIYTYSGATGLPIPELNRYVCNGADGNDGETGSPGGPGVPGKKGDPGEPGENAQQATVTFDQTSSCEIEVEQIQAFPDYIFKLSLQDSGWKDLRGFNHYTGVMATLKPKVRKIGKALHFKGTVYIPLSSDTGATLIDLAASTTYDNQPYNQVYTGIGGVTVNTGGSVTFNRGTSVLPIDLDFCAGSIDDTYQKQVISSRQIVTSGGTDGASLSAVFQVFITADGYLVLQTLRDIEDGSVGVGSNVGGSALRYITSKVKSGEYVPDFRDSASLLHSNPVTGTQNIEANFSARTYLFDCDAAEPNQIGGFSFKLDGLTVFLT